MLRLISKFTITQVATESYPDRNEVYTFNFVNSCTINSSWQNLTDTAKLVFPKKIYFVNSQGKKVMWDGKNTSGTGNNLPPLILRGDKIKIELGYIYPTAENPETVELNEEFNGYISKISSKIPIQIECEDMMFILKQKKLTNKVYKASEYDVQKMVREMLDSFPETKGITLVTGTATSQTISTKIGDFRTMEDSIGSVLDRLKKDARIYSWFRGNELRCSGLVYYPSDRVEHNFVFQQNIINGDGLEYKRVDDIVLGAKAYSINKTELSATNESGRKKSKRERLETFVGERTGEIRTLYFYGVETEAKLKALAEQELRKFYYTGYTGDFLTFGLPSVKHGDEAKLKNTLLPEMNGGYLIKGVEKMFGVETAYRQRIILHLKLDQFDTATINAGL
jgi:hypothetical protein